MRTQDQGRPDSVLEVRVPLQQSQGAESRQKKSNDSRSVPQGANDRQAKKAKDFISYVDERLFVSTEPGPQLDVRKLLHQVLKKVEQGTAAEDALMQHAVGRRRAAVNFMVEALELNVQLSKEALLVFEALNSRSPKDTSGDVDMIGPIALPPKKTKDKERIYYLKIPWQR